MNKANRFSLILDEVSTYDDPTAIVNMIMTRIESLAAEYKVDIDLKDTKARLLQYISTHGKCPVHGDKYVPGCKYAHHESLDLFKSRLKDTITAYTSLLKKAKAKNPWLDLKALIEPLTKIEYSSK